MLNEDYRDMLRALSDEKVKFLLVGAYALAAHGYPRATVDIDVWVMPSPDNADAVLRALRRLAHRYRILPEEDLQNGRHSFPDRDCSEANRYHYDRHPGFNLKKHSDDR